MKKIICESLDELPSVARQVIAYCKDEPIWLFNGRMGAGKTTLIKEIASQMGVEDLVSSPSYSMINEYVDKDGKAYYHFDFYRVEDPAEALDLGVEEYFYSGNYCWVEWAEKISSYIPDKFVQVDIDVDLEGLREIKLRTINDGQNQNK